MSQDQPELTDLLETVQAFLVGFAPLLEGKAKFDVQISAHLLGIASRELRAGEASDDADRAAYAQLLGVDGSLAELKLLFCQKLRRGELDACWDKALNTALDEVTRKVLIVRPEHLGVAGKVPGNGPSAAQ